MWPDRLSNLGRLALESDALPTVLCGPAGHISHWHLSFKVLVSENSLDVNYTTVSPYPYMYII